MVRNSPCIGAREKNVSGGEGAGGGWEGAEVKLLKKLYFIEYAHDSLDHSHFPTCFYLLYNMLIRKKIISMILKTVSFLYKMISTYWCATNQGI